MNYYSVLGVSKKASAAAVKLAFRQLAMQHHPDRQGNADQFVALQQAYAVLSDPAKRKQYDCAIAACTVQAYVQIGLTVAYTGGLCPVAIYYNNKMQLVVLDIPPRVANNSSVTYPSLFDDVDVSVCFCLMPDSQWRIDDLDLICYYTLSAADLHNGCTITVQGPDQQQHTIAVGPGTKHNTYFMLSCKGLASPSNNCDGYTVVKVLDRAQCKLQKYNPF